MKHAKIGCLLAALTGAASAAGQIWDNGALDADDTPSVYLTMLDTVYPFHCQVADDFRLNEQNSFTGTVVITEVTWYGKWASPDDPPVEPTDFNIILYRDIGGFPTGHGADDPTPTSFAIRTVPRSQVIEQPLNDWVSSYVCDLSADPIAVDPARTYWLAIQSVNFFPPKWSWSANEDTEHGRRAVQGFPLIGLPYWTRIEYDMAFLLDGFETQPGDLTGDGCVDQADLGLLLASYGIDADGDVDGDGDTDQADLGALLAHFGDGC